MDLPSNNFSRKRCLNFNTVQLDQENISIAIKRARTMPEVAGKIICIELENFMCHSTLKLNFDIEKYNCSYIVGSNGSGKSALFASLNIGLGGSGRSNERGKTLQSYIKEGSNYARIKIHLTNEGPNSLCDYNEVIIIERLITEKTTNFSIKTRSFTGAREEVKEKIAAKHHIEMILQQFNIELDNPLSWLSQDRSRQFLQSMKPDRLYELYKKSSEIDSSENLFRCIDAHFEELTKIMESMDKEKRAKEDKYKEMKIRYDSVNLLKEKKTEINLLYWYKLWAPIRDKQNEISEVRQNFEANKQKSGVDQKRKEELLVKIKEVNRKQSNFEQEHAKSIGKIRQHEEKLNEHKRKIRELDFDLHELNGSIKMNEMKVRGIEEEVKQAKQTLTEITGNSNRDVEFEKKELENKQNEINNEIDTVEENRQKCSTELRTIELEYQNQRRSLHLKWTEYSQLEDQKKRIIDEKDLFEKSKIDKLVLYGQDIPTLLKLIDANRNLFKKLPIGPIGNFIKLKDARWADPIEFILRNCLGTFLCDSADDRRIFDEICTKNRIQKPSLITTDFAQHKFDTLAREPPPEFLTILRVLDIENANVYNYILDKTHVETTLLIEQDDIARDVMYPNPPLYANKAMTLACSEINPERGRRAFQYFRGSGNFHSRVFANRFVANNSHDFQMQLQHIEQQLRTKSVAVQELKSNVQTIEKNITDLRGKISHYTQRLNGLNEKHYNVDEQLQKLEDIMLSGDRIMNLKNSLQELDSNRQKFREQLNNLNARLKEKNEKNMELQSKLRAYHERSSFLKNETNQIQSEIKSCQIQMEKVQRDIDQVDSSIEKGERLSRKYTDDIENNELIYNHLRQEAESKCGEFLRGEILNTNPGIGHDPPDFEQIPVTSELDKNIKEIEKIIRREEQNREPAPNRDDLLKYQNEYTRFKAKVKIWSGRVEKIEQLIQNRKKKFNLLKVSLPRKMECHFKDYMNYRGYKASLEVDDNRGIITIKVETHKVVEDEQPNTEIRSRSLEHRDEHRDGNTCKKKVMQDLKGLSGGERSFTTACFVMALWDCMESPFRCLDEFDVFMDMINRRVVMEMLADLTKDHKEIQFIFFTPQPIQELKCDDIQVFTLKKNPGTGIFDNQMENEDMIQDTN